jgi:uncharacterized membrane protein YdjX (TVP38/TMEM64 family)
MEAESRTMSAPEARKPGWIRPVLIVGVLIGVIALVKYFVTPERIKQLDSTLESLGVWGPLVYIVVYIIGTLVFLPGLALTAGAGLFGAVWGTVYVSIASTIGASLAFLLGRTALRPMVEGWASENTVFKKIDEGVETHGWRMIMITRLVPIFPFNFQNYAYGLTRINFWTYVLVSWICMLPGTAAYVIAFSSIKDGGGDPKKTVLILAVAALLIVLLSFVPRILKKHYRIEDADPVKGYSRGPHEHHR